MPETVTVEEAIIWAQSAAELGRNMGKSGADVIVTDSGVESLPDSIRNQIEAQIKSRSKSELTGA